MGARCLSSTLSGTDNAYANKVPQTEGNTLKPYLPKTKTVIVLKMLVLECVA